MDGIVLFWKVAYTFLTHRKQGVLFQQDVFPFVLTFVIFALSWNQKKNVTFNWTCGDMFQLRKICDAWKVAHLSEMTQKARCDCFTLLCFAITAGSSRCLLRNAGCSVKAAVTPLPWEQRGRRQSGPCPCPRMLLSYSARPGARKQQQFAAHCVSRTHCCQGWGPGQETHPTVKPVKGRKVFNLFWFAVYPQKWLGWEDGSDSKDLPVCQDWW